jgi:THO complex subunit 2
LAALKSRPLQALARCLASQEYIHIHNAIVILKEILDFFPLNTVNNATGNEIFARVETSLATEKRKDLVVLLGS